MKSKSTNGSEIHRLKVFDHLDEAKFTRIYKTCEPLMRKLSYNIDTRK